MSIRARAALVIMMLIFVFITVSFFSNLSFTRRSITEAMERDLALAGDIADKLVSTKISLLKSDADTVAERLLKTPSAGEMTRAMASQMEEFSEFTSLTVYGRDYMAANVGDPLHDEIIITEGRYIQRAFDGEKIISTTHYNSVSGSFIMHIFVPMGEEMVLSSTISGMLFADLVSEFTLWQSGGIFMIDEEGTFIAARNRKDLVMERRNFIEEAKMGQGAKDIGDFFQTMINSKSGSGTYHFEGVERICSYKQISDSATGWRIGVLVPLSESPEASMQRDLLLSAAVFLAAGILLSILVSGLASRPFYRIEAQNKSLAELSEKASAASDAKTKFLANMSHEMRTPLNAIIGLSQLTLAAGGLDSDAQENIEKVNNAGTALLSLINDILNISKIEAGKLELTPVEYDSASVINDTVTQSIMRKGEKPIKFVLSMDENFPSRLFGDDLRIKEIINNLLSNAFKYTKEGTVELNIKSESINDDEVRLTIFVKDSGIGISAENIEDLFTDYSQMDIKANRKIEGTGLGLSITKRITEMMGGSISVESEFGKGSIFTVKLPQKVVDPAPIGSEVVHSLKNLHYSDSRSGHGLHHQRIILPYAKVLVVDDVATNLDVARGMMRPYKMQVDCVTSGREAVEAVREEKVRYNAIFMDQMMPEMDGIEAVRIIREEIGTEYAKAVPIIALTANAVAGTEEMFLKKGFQGFVSKPIEIPHLDAAIRQWVRNEELEKTLLEEQAASGGKNFFDKRSGQERRSGNERRSGYDRRIFAGKIERVNVYKGLERFSGDMKTYVQILRSFTGNSKPFLEIFKDIGEENLNEYTVKVHGLKSSCRGIGAEAAGTMAEALEKAGKNGDLAFIALNNPPLLAALAKLISDIEGALDTADAQAFNSAKTAKGKKEKPDAAVLSILLDACKQYKTGDVDIAIKELENFDYESGGDLVLWLRKNADEMNFSDIAAKLETVVKD